MDCNRHKDHSNKGVLKLNLYCFLVHLPTWYSLKCEVEVEFEDSLCFCGFYACCNCYIYAIFMRKCLLLLWSFHPPICMFVYRKAVQVCNEEQEKAWIQTEKQTTWGRQWGKPGAEGCCISSSPSVWWKHSVYRECQQRSWGRSSWCRKEVEEFEKGCVEQLRRSKSWKIFLVHTLILPAVYIIPLTGSSFLQ